MDEQVFIENGIGHFALDFLGERIVLGCVKNEEERASRNAAIFEGYAGEVLKAVSGIDQSRAVLMAGTLAIERVEELEDDLKQKGDRRFDSQTFDAANETMQALIISLEDLTDLVRTNNQFAVDEPEEQQQALAELQASKSLLSSRRISRSSLKALLLGVLGFLAMKFIDQPIGEAAALAWKTLKIFLSQFGSN